MRQVDHEYYEWLVSQIAVPNDKTYRELFEEMHILEFVWTVPNDNNRIQDGLDLRYEFFTNRPTRTLDLQSATFLEVLVSLSRRMAFIANGTETEWAWRLIKNLRLNRMSDPLTTDNSHRIRDILDSVIWRTYSPDGRGGFFPLSHPTLDQTKVEIWYQMNAYVIEMQES